MSKRQSNIAKIPAQVNQEQADLASQKLAVTPGWKIFACLVIGLSLTSGCGGGSAQQDLTAQALSKMQSQKSRQKFQHQLLSQVPKTSLSSYRDYQVGPEDLIEVAFFGNDELGREVRVNGRGEVSLPLIGGLKVEGLSPQEIEAKLAKLYKEGRFIRNPQITVIVKEYRHQRVMVTGAVVNPGSYEVIGPRTLLEMLGKAGGLIDKPEMKAGNMVYVIRHQNAPALIKVAKESQDHTLPPIGAGTVVIDLRRLLSGSELKLNLPIQNGDVVYVPPAKMAFVLGAVKKPGQVAVKDDLTATQAIALAEGFDPMLASNRVDILRFDDKGERIITSVNLKGITSGHETDPLLKENDIVFVQESGFRRFFFDFKNMFPGSVGFGVPIL